MRVEVTLAVCLLAALCVETTHGTWFWRTHRRFWRSAYHSNNNNNNDNQVNPDTTTLPDDHEAMKDPQHGTAVPQDTHTTKPPTKLPTKLPSESSASRREERKKRKVCDLLQKVVSKAGCDRGLSLSWSKAERRKCLKIRVLADKMARQLPGMPCDWSGDGSDDSMTTTTTPMTTTPTETPADCTTSKTESTTITSTESTTVMTTEPTTTTTSTTTTTQPTTSTTTTRSTTTPDFTCRLAGQVCVFPVGGGCPNPGDTALDFFTCPFPAQICCQGARG